MTDPRSGGSGPPEVVNLDSPSATAALREHITMLRQALLAIRGRVWREHEQRLVDAALAATEPQ